MRLPSAAAIVKSRSLSPRDFFLFRRQQARIPQFKAHFPAFLHISSPQPLHEQIERTLLERLKRDAAVYGFLKQDGSVSASALLVAEVSQPSAASIPQREISLNISFFDCRTRSSIDILRRLRSAFHSRNVRVSSIAHRHIAPPIFQGPCDCSAGDRTAATRHVQTQLTRCQQHKRQHADHAVHRGTDLVRHARQERGLGPALLLALCKTFLVLFNPPAQPGRAAEAEQIISIVLTAGHIQLHPLAVLCPKDGLERLRSVPRTVFLPDGNAFLPAGVRSVFYPCTACGSAAQHTGAQPPAVPQHSRSPPAESAHPAFPVNPLCAFLHLPNFIFTLFYIFHPVDACIYLYIIAPISVDLQHFSPIQPLSPTNFSPKTQKGYRTVLFCILLYQFSFKPNYSFASSDAISLLMICGLP